MALKVPIASFATTLTAKVSTTATTFYIDSTTADDGTDLDGLVLGFTVDKGKSTEEYIEGTVDTATSSLTGVIRGIKVSDGSTAGTGQIHRKKAVIEITAFPYLTDAIRVLNGTIAAGGIIKNPSTRTISDSRHLTDKEYVDSVAGAAGGISSFLATDAGGLNIDVGSGYFVTDDGVVTYAGVSGQAMTDDATNYVMLDTDGTLVVNTTGWVGSHTPIAIVTTVSGDITSVADARGWLTSPSSDRMLTDDYTYGATITAGQFVYLDTAAAKWKLADGAAESTASGIIGVALDSGVDTDTGKRVQLAGHVTGLTGLTAGYQYLSNTPGALSASAGTFKKMVGYAPNTTSVVLLPTYGPLQLDGVNSSATLANFNEAMTFFANTDITGAEAETLTSGATSNAEEKHSHVKQSAFSVQTFQETVISATDPMTFVQVKATMSPDGNHIYFAQLVGANPNLQIAVLRYALDTVTGQYAYAGTTTSLAQASSDFGNTGNFGIGVSSTYFWVTALNSAGTGTAIYRYARNLTGKQLMTISGSPAFTTGAGIAADDTNLWVFQSGGTSVQLFTISGTTATVSTTFAAPSNGDLVMGPYYDGTDILFINRNATGNPVTRINTSGTSQGTTTARFWHANTTANLSWGNGEPDPIACGPRVTGSVYTIGVEKPFANGGAILRAFAVTKP